MKKILLTCLCLCSSLFAEKTEVLFHLHDAGETYALLPVIRQMDVDYLIVATGAAVRLLKEIPKSNLRAFEEMPSIEPEKVITGVASEIQGQTLDFFHERGVSTIAFWDNFNAEGPSSYFERAHAIEKKAELLLLPCESLVSAFMGREYKVVGHPTLDVQKRPKLAVWIGGYGEKYEESYAIFQEGMKQIKGFVVLTQHHPKTSLINDLKTSDAIAIADVVICHQTSAAFQALAQNKPVLHVIPDSQYFDSIPLQKGLAKKVSTVEDFAKVLEETCLQDVSGFYEIMGIPKNSTERINKAIFE